MEINSKKKKDALNATESQRSSRAGSSTATNVSSMVSESQATDQSLSSLSQSEVVYNSSIVSSSGQDMMGVSSSCNLQASKFLKIGTSPGSQKLLAYMGKNQFTPEISKIPLALQPEALVNTSGPVLFSSPDKLIQPAYCQLLW